MVAAAGPPSPNDIPNDPALGADRAPLIDPPAARRTRQRLAAAKESPWLHAEVGRRMAARLAVLREPPVTVLDWWSDIGGAPDALRAACPRAAITRVAVPGQRPTPGKPSGWWPFGRSRNTLLVAADVPEAAADLVWSNMALHFEPDRAALPAAWLRALRVGGFLMLSTFGPDTLRELRGVYRRLGWGALQGPFEDMHDIGDRLVATGFAEPVMDQEQLTLTYASAADLLIELRGFGANLHPARHPGLRTPRWRAAWIDAVQGLAGADGRIRVTLEIAYGHAVKPAPRATVGGTTVLKLDEMRSQLRGRRAGQSRLRGAWDEASGVYPLG
jgi:malonyl-CoA O-methyltransferase